MKETIFMFLVKTLTWSNLTPEASTLKLLCMYCIYIDMDRAISTTTPRIRKKMKLDFFTNLPSKIINNILSRLPIRTIAVSKCVCKQWLHLLKSDEFVNSHLAKSVPALAVWTSTSEIEWDSSSCTIFKFEDEPHDLRYQTLVGFDFPHDVGIAGSANGLLFLCKLPEVHFVCNPITLDYIELHFPEELIRPYPKVVNYPEILQDSGWSYPPSITYGFGASKISKEYKVVRIYHGSVIVHTGEAEARRRIIPESECYVHTLGTDSWRRVEPGAPFEYLIRASCVFVNGSLHWIVSDSNEKLWISCFDLETERFSSFSTPPLVQESPEVIGGLSALGDCLCLCDHTAEVETAIWLMREYGEVNSWTKEYAIILNNEFLDVEGFELIYPLKVFKDGDILMLREDREFLYFSAKTGAAREVGISPARRFNAALITPSFLSLKSFGMENVESF